MPSFEEEYSFEIAVNFDTSEELRGGFFVAPPSKDNHGIVRVADTYHFAYEDGTPYYPVGTTCYVWHLQTEELQRQTLESLAHSPFNKIRFCVFPKHYLYNFTEPSCYPFAIRESAPWSPSDFTKEKIESAQKTPYGLPDVGIDEPEKVWDFSIFNPEYFRHLENTVESLGKLGIEADIILMHPYDRWGFSHMGTANENFYLKYVVARLSAYRNIWWSMANEFDLFFWKQIPDWESNAATVCKADPYRHLRSIHNCMTMYDHTRAWITHCSLQRIDLYKTAENTSQWRDRYKKPAVLDEIAYEGNISYGWGNISGEELTRRFWEAYTRGGYGGHGETYVHESEVLWWSHGGVLRGESPARIAFLLKIIKDAPTPYLKPTQGLFDETVLSDALLGMGSYYVHYYGFGRPKSRDYRLPLGKNYTAKIVDTWEMEISDPIEVSGEFTLKLPGKEYIAVIFREVDK
jgi:hypothetical protein